MTLIRTWEPFTAEELVSAWYYIEVKGKSAGYLAKRLGRSRSAYNTVLVRMRRVLKGEERPRTPEWYSAVVKIKANDYSSVAPLQQAQQRQAEESDTTYDNTASDRIEQRATTDSDPLTKLEALFNAFSQGLVEVIDQEAKRRSEQEVQDLKTKYEAELRRVQEVLVEAQNGSVVGLLRKKWSQQ